jgi:hypothetical protein
VPYTVTGLLQSKIAYLVVVLAGAVAAWRATQPPQLRWLRIFQMLLLPVLFCAVFRGVAGLVFGTLHPVIAVPLLLTAAASLFLTLAPNLVWSFQSSRLESLTAPRRKPQLLDDTHLQPIRQLIDGQQFGQACARFEILLKSHRGDFPQIRLLTQLYHQLKRNKQAERSALQMIGLARNISEQLTAMHFYHELTGDKPKPAAPKMSEAAQPASSAQSTATPAAVAPAHQPAAAAQPTMAQP